MSEKEVKVITGRPGRPKGVNIISSRPAATGEVEVIRSGVRVVDQTTPEQEQPKVEITHGEGDSGAPEA